MLENMAKNRIGNARIHVTVAREIMVLGAVHDMLEKLGAHDIKKVLFCPEVGIKCAPPYICFINNGLYSNL